MIQNYLSAFMIWLSITGFHCFQYILRMLPSLVMPELMNKFNVGATDFGIFSGIYYIGYVIAHIPIGIILSRIGGKIVMPACIIMTALGLLPLVYADSWALVLIGRLIIGIGSSAAIIGALQIFRTIFPMNFTRMLGLMVCLGLLSAVYINKPLFQMVNLLGTKIIINILTVAGFGLAIATSYLLPKHISSPVINSVRNDIKLIITNYKLLVISILAGLMVSPLEGFADAWGTSFLKEVYNLDLALSSDTISLMLIGMCAGCIALPLIADKTQSYYGITLLAAIIMGSAFKYLLSGSADVHLLKIVCFLIGFFCAYQIVIIAKISTYVPEQLSGTAAAIANMIIMGFGYVFHTIIGLRMDSLWDGIVENGVHIYNRHAYINSLSVIVWAMLIAAIGFIITMIYTRKSRVN